MNNVYVCHVYFILDLERVKPKQGGGLGANLTCN